MTTLDQIGIQSGCDKSSTHHGYLDIYQTYLDKWRHKYITLIEAGVGGYQYADRGGNSARMFREYFTQARIITFDIHPKHPIHGVEVLQGSQDDREFIESLPECEVFIDDCSHASPLCTRTFELAWPLVKTGGLYIIEDTHASYWDQHGYEGNPDPEQGLTTMNFFKRLADELNREHYAKEYHLPVSGLKFVHFYSKVIIVGKV